MPSRNSDEQLEKEDACVSGMIFPDKRGRYKFATRFICEALRNERTKTCNDAAWALVGHELAATSGLDNGMFSPATIAKYPLLEQRIK